MKKTTKFLSLTLLLTAVLFSVSATPSFADNDDASTETDGGIYITKVEEL